MNEFFPGHHRDPPAAIEGEDSTAIGRHQRHTYGKDIRIPVAQREAEAIVLVVLASTQNAGANLRPEGRIAILFEVSHVLIKINLLAYSEVGASQRAGTMRNRCAGLELEMEGGVTL